MKKLLSCFAFLAITAVLFAQAPQSFRYQLVVRAADGSIVANKTVKFKISILQDNATGSVAYCETHTAATGISGEATLTIGTGTPVTNTFAAISWATHSHFLKVELDATGGTNYIFYNTSEILSVPYAMYAGNIDGAVMLGENGGVKVTDNTATTGVTNGTLRYNSTIKKMQYFESNLWHNTDGTPTIGEFKFGGIVFYVDGTGNHGLVCATSDQSDGIQWYNGTNTTTGAVGTAIGTGKNNTSIIINNQGEGMYAAKICYDLILNGFDDWFLPSVYEFFELCYNKEIINATALVNGGGIFKPSTWYWTSSESSFDFKNARPVNSNSCTNAGGLKYLTNPVRAIRAF